MAASSEYVSSGAHSRRKLVHLHNPDGTDESAGVVKIDVSALTFGGGQVPTYVSVLQIDYNVNGDPVTLYFDANTDDVLAVLPPGSGTLDFSAFGGKKDPKSTGTTGDVKLVNVSGTEYDIAIHFNCHR